MTEVSFQIGKRQFNSQDFFLIAGPCVLEESQIGYEIACAVKEIAGRFNVPVIFKASYTKANRTSKDGYRGVGPKKGLAQLARIQAELDLPVLSDVHSEAEVLQAAEVLDVLQIPAFLCRQTELLEAAADTGKAINIKKGQFMAPWDMKHAVDKVVAMGNERIFLTERGAMFGYNNLVVDIRSFPIMSRFGCLVVFDGTHSTQLPGGGKGETAGQREMIPYLVRAAVAAGCHGLFLEVHPEPLKSPSDRESILPLKDLAGLLEEALAIRKALRQSSKA